MLKRWLRQWLGIAAPEGAVPPVQAQRSRKISAEVMATARAAAASRGQEPHAATPYSLPKPLPGVVPDDKTMAMDRAIVGAYEFAAGTDFAHEGLIFPGYTYLAELTQRSEYRRPAETLAREMTRKWITIEASGDEDKTNKIDEINKFLDDLGVREAFREIAEQDGFFGRSQLYLDTGDGDNPAELQAPLILDKAKISKGKLKAIRVIEPYWTYPASGSYSSSNPLAENFYCPSSWYVMGTQIHGSRLLTFVSREVPDILKPAYMFGGLSLSQIAKPTIDNWLRTRDSVGDIINDYTVFGIKTDMSSVMNAGGGEELRIRAELFNVMRDNRGLMTIAKGGADDPGEEFFNVSAPLSGLDHLQAQSQEHMASAVGEPLVILTGITPSGLNASSDGEIRVWYDNVHSAQELLFRPHLKTIIDIVQLSLFAEIDPTIGFKFNPLYQLDEAGLAAVQKTKAETHDIYLTAGVVRQDEARQALSADEESPYAGLDLDAEEAPGPPDMDVPEQFDLPPDHRAPLPADSVAGKELAARGMRSVSEVVA